MTCNDGSEPFEPGDIFSSEEVIDRIAYLEGIEVIDREPEDQEELDRLYEFAEEAKGYVPDWEYGETFISDDYFEDYARELAEDIGAIDPNASWPLNHIDWEAAADGLKMDYTSFEYEGMTYWAR